PLDLARPTDDRARETRVGRLGRPPAYEPPPQALKISVHDQSDVHAGRNSSPPPQPPTSILPRLSCRREPISASRRGLSMERGWQCRLGLGRQATLSVSSERPRNVPTGDQRERWDDSHLRRGSRRAQASFRWR